MFRRLLVLGLTLPLLACEGAEITTPPVMITAKNPAGAVGIDVYARARARGNPVPRFRGQDTLNIRTRGKTADGGFAEITGISCTLNAGLYTAKFQTPANVVVPDYGPNSPALFTRCVHPDGRSGSATVNAYNFTAQQRNAGAAGGGILGAIIIGAVAAAPIDPERDEFRYPPISIRLK